MKQVFLTTWQLFWTHMELPVLLEYTLWNTLCEFVSRTIGMVYRQEGVGALYKGLLPKVLRLGPGGAIMLLVYEKVMNLLNEAYPD